jgi:hypothetical protein
MFGNAVKIVLHAALAAGAAIPAIGLATAPLAAAVDAQTLVGSWAGPPTFGDLGDCGTGAGVFAFSPNGVYRFVAGSDGCGMVMIDGRYELQPDGGALQLSIDECGDPGCPPGPSTMTVSATGPDAIVLNGQTYLRQHG